MTAAYPEFAIEPYVGIGPVRLGMTREEVRRILAEYPGSGLDQTSRPSMDYAFGNSLQADYKAGLVVFIGASFHPGCGCDYTFRGRHIGDYPAEELFALLSQLDGGIHSYNADEYHFSRLAMALWDADPQYDYRNGEARAVFSQVAVIRLADSHG